MAVYIALFGLNFGQNRPFFALQKSNLGFAFENERTVRSMFLSLRKHGLPLSDIRVESGSSNLSGANVTYGLNTFNASVRVWMDHVEVYFSDLRRVSVDQMLEITEIALDVIQRLVQNIEMELYRTSDSLLKMDIRAAHEWRRLKVACL